MIQYDGDGNAPILSRLCCEYVTAPLGVDTTRPRFSWRATSHRRNASQSAWQMIVSATPGLLLEDKGDMWDSGRVESGAFTEIVYDGSPLVSGRDYYWKVRIWDDTGEASAWSEVSTFAMGLLHPRDWKANWITVPDFEASSPLFRKMFRVSGELRRAMVYMSGLGYSELSLNGTKVGDHVLDPGWTDYAKRVLYTTCEVTGYLQQGDNALGVMLGTGWAYMSFNGRALSNPKLILQLELEYLDGSRETVISSAGENWFVTVDGPVRGADVYHGEFYDATREKRGWDEADFDMEDPVAPVYRWKKALETDGPGGRLVSQVMEPIRVMGEVKPVSVTNPKPGVYVFDLGQNFAGWIRLRAAGARGTRVVMKHSELLYSDGTVNQENLRLAQCTDTYILKGGGEERYQPRFTYRGFRYVQLEGYPGQPELGAVTGCIVRSAVEEAGFFSCSNELLNRLQQAVVRTEASNLHSLPTDCPQRDERLGWLNDCTVRAEEAVYNFHMAALFAKWMGDITDTQSPSGAITDTAPFKCGRQPADPVTMSYVLLPLLLYRHYGDIRTLTEHYEGLKAWVAYLGKQAEDHILAYSYYGDWAAPVTETVKGSMGEGAVSAKTEGALVSTGFYYYGASLLYQAARILGLDKEAEEHRLLAERIREAFNKRFYDKEKASYSSGNQASNALPLYMGIVPEEDAGKVAQRIAEDVKEHDYHLTTGNICTKYMLEALTEHGYVETAYALAVQESYPSWGYMLANGATTIWERWEFIESGELVGMASHNHPMYGSISTWFYKYLAGIRADSGLPGFRSLVIKPYFPRNLEQVQCRLDTMAGPVVSNWRKYQDELRMEIQIPFGSQAAIYIPRSPDGCHGYRLEESGSTVWDESGCFFGVPGLTGMRTTNTHLELQAGSGQYSFILKLTPNH